MHVVLAGLCTAVLVTELAESPQTARELRDTIFPTLGSGGLLF
jgi:hypothetical protein